MICTLSKHMAEAEGFDDALMLDWRGQIAEGTGANIFLVINGELHTPTPDCFQRDHPPDGDRPGAQTRHQGGRAGNHAGRVAKADEVF
jgi:hypothetical protein